MAKIKFVREYKAYDGQGTMYDVIYESRANTYYIGEGSPQHLPKTVINYMEQAKVKVQHDRWRGEEKIYEA
jgi:hypothetical protein